MSSCGQFLETFAQYTGMAKFAVCALLAFLITLTSGSFSLALHTDPEYVQVVGTIMGVVAVLSIGSLFVYFFSTLRESKSPERKTIA